MSNSSQKLKIFVFSLTKNINYIHCMYISINRDNNRIYVKSEEDIEGCKVSIYDEDEIKFSQETDFKKGVFFWYEPITDIKNFARLIIRINKDDILLDEYVEKYRYCQIPKAGGVSICDYLNIEKNHIIVDKNFHPKIFLFTFVRNPYDRIVSSYFYLKNGGRMQCDIDDRDEFIKDYTFEEFIKNNLLYASENQIHFRPQHYWIPNGVDYIGKFENLENDFFKIIDLLNIEKKPLKKLNTSEHYHYDEYYTQDLKDIIYDIYKYDFIKFNYNK
jgi:chondroitin 4-sulfotransferase 11